MRQVIAGLPGELARTITWDQGKEMACHADSPSPPASRSILGPAQAPAARFQREHQRAAAPVPAKGTDLPVHSPAGIARIAASLNGRPRKTLGYMTPSEKLTEIIACAV